MALVAATNRSETPAEASSISDGIRRSGTCPAPRPEIHRPPLQVGGQGRTHQAKPFDVRAIMDLPTPSGAQLRALFGLTPSEARLAQLLACGDTVEEVAQALGVKLTTVRSQVAVIFSKTGVHRQAKLVAMLSRIAHLADTA
jgi:DNA-binding CsgD family transcriptional regulator